MTLSVLTPYSLDIARRFGRKYCLCLLSIGENERPRKQKQAEGLLVSPLTFSFTVKMEAVCLSSFLSPHYTTLLPRTLLYNWFTHWPIAWSSTQLHVESKGSSSCWKDFKTKWSQVTLTHTFYFLKNHLNVVTYHFSLIDLNCNLSSRIVGKHLSFVLTLLELWVSQRLPSNDHCIGA